MHNRKIGRCINSSRCQWKYNHNPIEFSWNWIWWSCMSIDTSVFLPESSNAIVAIINSLSRSNMLNFDDVDDLVLNEEIPWRELSESSMSSILHTESRGRNSTRANGPGRSKYWGITRNKSRNNNFKAWKCWELDLWEDPTLYKSTQYYIEGPKGKGIWYFHLNRRWCIDMLLESKEESWVLESRASFRTTLKKELFERYVLRNLGKEYLGDGQPFSIIC